MSDTFRVTTESIAGTPCRIKTFSFPAKRVNGVAWHPDHLQAALAFKGRRHPDELPYEDRSKFDSFTIIDEAIARSTEYPAMVADGANRNYVIAFDMGYEVGFHARAKRRTSAVTVILSPVGEVITVHPGTPWSKDWTET